MAFLQPNFHSPVYTYIYKFVRSAYSDLIGFFLYLYQIWPDTFSSSLQVLQKAIKDIRSMRPRRLGGLPMCPRILYFRSRWMRVDESRVMVSSSWLPDPPIQALNAMSACSQVLDGCMLQASAWTLVALCYQLLAGALACGLGLVHFAKKSESDKQYYFRLIW